ncbi:GntR family transcriptional regulator [Cohnella lubricantis]|uniref:GntR family transcriptional regulator n=1 Tax=Cohnella lubricantis TaxID=2163172 RepID=A0A841TGK6_9BACL|nr:GntR family transcriptional regulator [Cohnella lubricantis]MBB6678398.1 GntR family transcriptional regulator [Cohnella lubricantis]MBP2116778.1 GntR family transcriptional regulator [Cohnella lubricantis]
MNSRGLDPKSPIPLYHQLKEILLQKINDGEWETGDIIPTENDLIRQYNVSRTTVREAVNTLVGEGRLEKKQGRGTTVSKPKIEQVLGRLTGFSERISGLGFQPGAGLLEAAFVPTPEPIREKMNGTDQLFFVKRIRLADGEPIAIEETYWPLDVARLFQDNDLNTISFYPVLESNGIRLSHAEESITAVVAGKDQAKHLQIKAGAPLLSIHRVAYDAGGTPVQYCSNYYRSDRYSYKVRLER